MLSRRTFFALLTMALMGAGASVIRAFAADPVPNYGADYFEAGGLDFAPLPKSADSGRHTAQEAEVDIAFEVAPQELQKRYIDLHTEIAATVKADELKSRIADAEKLLQQSAYARELHRIVGELEKLKGRFPEADSGMRIERAIQVLEPEPGRYSM